MLVHKIKKVVVHKFGLERLAVLAWRDHLHAIKLVGLGFISVMALVTAVYASIEMAYADRIYPRVFVSQTSLGNLTREQAREQLSLVYRTIVAEPIVLASNERTWEISPASINLQIDIDQTISQAFAVGHDRDSFKNIRMRVPLLWSQTRLPPVIHYDAVKLQAKVDEITQGIEIAPISSKISYVDGQFIAAPSVEGKRVDQVQLEQMIARHIADRNRSPIELPLVTAQPALTAQGAQKLIPALAQYVEQPLTLTFEDTSIAINTEAILGLINYAEPTAMADATADFSLSREKLTEYIAMFAVQIDQPAKDALFNFVDGKVVAFQPSQDGISVDREALAQAIEDTLVKGGESRVIVVPVNRTKPSATTETVNDLGIKELVGRGESNFRNSPSDRIYNIRLAASRINGVIIKPGEEFSFNTAVGDISAATGYKQALVILSGRTVLGDGGGVCQVSTTVFRAALEAGLPITARTAHAFRVSYYENDRGPGFDATIYQPGVDFKFKNDTGQAILLQAQVDEANTKLAINLYGTSDGRVASVSKATYYSTSPVPPEVRQDDPNLPKGVVKQVEKAVPGAKVGFTRTVTRNGETIIQETFSSNFRPWAAVYLVGTKEG